MNILPTISRQTSGRSLWLGRMAGLGLAVLPLAPVFAAEPSPAQVQLAEQIGGNPAKASTEAIVAAIVALVQKNPSSAPDLIAAAGQLGRPGLASEIPSLVSAAIGALGPKPKADIVLGIIQQAVIAAPKASPASVFAAVKAAPRELADGIVERAVASLPDPTLQVDGVTVAEAIVQQALLAMQGDGNLPPIAAGPDGGGGGGAAGIYAAANRGFQTSLTRFLGLGTAGAPPPSFQSLGRIVQQPNGGAGGAGPGTTTLPGIGTATPPAATPPPVAANSQ